MASVLCIFLRGIISGGTAGRRFGACLTACRTADCAGGVATGVDAKARAKKSSLIGAAGTFRRCTDEARRAGAETVRRAGLCVRARLRFFFATLRFFGPVARRCHGKTSDSDAAIAFPDNLFQGSRTVSLDERGGGAR